VSQRQKPVNETEQETTDRLRRAAEILRQAMRPTKADKNEAEN
jgi:hypothetical protein